MTELLHDDHGEDVRYSELEGRLSDLCVDAYNGHNAKDITTVLKQLVTKFEGSVDLDNADERPSWGGRLITTVAHPITGDVYNVYDAGDRRLIRVKVNNVKEKV